MPTSPTSPAPGRPRAGETASAGRLRHPEGAGPPLLIGVSARIYYPGTPGIQEAGVWTKTLHYLEQSVAHWLLGGGAVPVMVPAVDRDSLVKRSDIHLDHYAQALDGLVL